eukprot:GILK01007300.1.p1 GENE.GILK01007300.1~~GILK01007300.1.p1  ORF type:complete len:165 (+),score=9.02 GILK01007300.1:46-540(+)
MVLPTFTRWWLYLSLPIILWDASFVLLRPFSFSAGLWFPYQTYISVDKRYGDMEDSFVITQSIANLMEVCLAYLALIAHHRKSRLSLILALVSCVMTWSKTAIYLGDEFISHMKFTRHNSPSDLLLLYIIPSSFWLVCPLVCTVQTANELLEPRTSVSASRKKQ